MKKLYLLLFLLLNSCSTLTHIVTEPVEKPNLNIDVPSSLVLREVKFVVLHKDNAESYFSSLQKEGIEPVVFALEGNDYKSLAFDIEQIKNYIKLQKKVIQLYQEYYEKENKSR